MNMDKTAAFFGGSVVVVMALVLVAITVNNKMDNNAIERMVAHGANPLDAYCAIRADSRNAGLCTVRALKE